MIILAPLEGERQIVKLHVDIICSQGQCQFLIMLLIIGGLRFHFDAMCLSHHSNKVRPTPIKSIVSGFTVVADVGQ